VVGLVTTGLGFLLPARWIGWGCIAAGLFVAAISATWAIASRRRASPVIIKPDLPPNIQRLQSDLIKVQQAGGRFDESPSGRDAAIVEFGNEPRLSGAPVGALKDVDAQIFYYAIDGALLHRTHHGFWLGQENPAAQFPPRSCNKLLLALLDESVISVPDNFGNFSAFNPPDEQFFAEKSLNIEVQLVAGEHAEWTQNYVFKLRNEPDNRGITYEDEESS